MTAAQVSFYDPDMTLVTHVAKKSGLRWQDEHNTPGMGSVRLPLDTVLAKPVLKNYFNVVQIRLDGQPVKAWIVTRIEVEPGDAPDRWVTFSGPGVLALVQNAVVYPEYTLRRHSADSRSFDFGSKDGSWRVTSEWHAPLGIRQGSATSIRAGYPLRWPDPAAQWLWRTSPNAANTSGTNWFRGQFTLAADTRISIYAAGDDRLWLQLDGEEVINRGVRGWRTPAVYTADLAAGTHLIAAAVQNVQTIDPLRSGAFLCSVARVDRNNKILAWIKRSTPASFMVKGYGRPPGFFGPSIWKTLVTEAQARGVAGLAPVTFGFSDTIDSDGVAWTERNDRRFDIGSRDLLDVTAQLTETDFDLDMDGDLQLQAWKSRGTDLSDTVQLLPRRDLAKRSASGFAGNIRNRALVRHGGGWGEHSDNPSIAAYGRRETGMVVGSTDSDEQAEVFSTAAFLDLGRPEETVPLVTTGQAGPQPYLDYNLGDVITAPDLWDELGPARVMAFTVEEDDSGLLTITTDTYPDA